MDLCSLVSVSGMCYLRLVLLQCLLLGNNSTAVLEVFQNFLLLIRILSLSTGVKLNSTFTAKVHQSSLQLKLIPEDSGNHHYKPGLSYYGLVLSFAFDLSFSQKLSSA